jgi:hypothetical protein
MHLRHRRLVLMRPIMKSHLSQKLTGLTLQDSSLAPKAVLLASFGGLMPLD